MKWFNTNNTKMIDLNSVNGFVYISAKECIEQNLPEKDVDDFKQNGDKLEVIIGGSVFVFRGDTANELYNLLLSVNGRELLKG